MPLHQRFLRGTRSRERGQGPHAGAAQDGRYARQQPAAHVVADEWLRDGSIAQRLDRLRHSPGCGSPLARLAREVPRQVVTLPLGCKRSDMAADGANHRARRRAGSTALGNEPRHGLARGQSLVPGAQGRERRGVGQFCSEGRLGGGLGRFHSLQFGPTALLAG